MQVLLNGLPNLPHQDGQQVLLVRTSDSSWRSTSMGRSARISSLAGGVVGGGTSGRSPDISAHGA